MAKIKLSPFAHEQQSWFIPLLVASMVFLSGLMLVSVVSLYGFAARWDDQLRYRMVAEVPASAVVDRGQQVVDWLGQQEPVAKASIIPQQQLGEWLQPWLGQNAIDIIKDLPVPMLIDIQLHENQSDRAAALATQLKKNFPEIDIEQQGGWLADILRVVEVLKLIAMVIVVLMLGITLLAVSYTARTRLAIHRDEVELLHIMGASDRYVAKQFEWQAIIAAAKGAMMGMGFVVLLLAVMANSLIQGPEFVTLAYDMAWLLGVVLLCLPVVVILAAMITARWSVLSVLRAMP